MNESFFIGAVGAHQQQKRLNQHGNNIANVNSYGFKADKGRFAALMSNGVKNTEGDLLPVGVGAALWSDNTDFSQGGAVETFRAQDYMIDGSGFFALADLATGEISLTRNGAFVVSSLQRATDEVDEYGQTVMEEVFYLSDGEGRFVLGEAGEMIRVTDPNEHYAVGVYDYINYDGMQHVEDSRFLAVDKNGGIRRGEGTVLYGTLETSNVDLAEEMSKVIETQRAYSMALKMVLTSDEIESTINSLKS